MRWAPFGLALTIWLGPIAALADGAFPDESQLFLPASTQRLVLGTNFGLVQSTDDGAHWDFICESHISGTNLVQLYALGPDGAIYAASSGKVFRSSDDGCSWSSSTGLEGLTVSDVFVDALMGTHVWAIASNLSSTPATNGIYLSTDGAATFGTPIVTEPHGGLTGVETSATTEGTVEVAGYQSPSDGGTDVPYLMRTTDLGQHWDTFQHPELGQQHLGIAQIDPNDDQTIYLRVGMVAGQDQLGITHDGGRTIDIALDLGEAMSSFALGADGSLYVGSHLGHLWGRGPSDASFTQMNGPSLRCLAARGSTLYACADNFGDGFAVGASTDRGHSFQPLLLFQQIDTLASCNPVQQSCAVALHTLQVTVGYTGSSTTTGGSMPPSKSCGCSESDALVLPWGLGALMAKRRSRRGRRH